MNTAKDKTIEEIYEELYTWKADQIVVEKQLNDKETNIDKPHS